MFISAVSAKTASNTKVDDGLNGIGDISPASFRVEFDEPVKIKNADIELVSCSISKPNSIIIDESNNTLSVRMGAFYDAIVTGKTCLSEQYVAKVKPGTYTVATLAESIASELNHVMPCAGYRGWSGLSNLGKIQLTYKIPTSPGDVDFADLTLSPVVGVPGKAIAQYGVPYTMRDGLNKYVKVEPPADLVNAISNPNDVPQPNTSSGISWLTCGGYDIGSKQSDRLSRTSIADFGLWEGVSKQGMRAILVPKECLIESSFDKGFGGFSGATARPTYFTYEFENDNKYTIGDRDLTSRDENGGMFRPETHKQSEPRTYENQSHRQINGCCNVVSTAGDTRGAPYKYRHHMLMPYTNDPNIALPQKKRKVYYDTNWTGQLTFHSSAGGQSSSGIPAIPKNYTFQIDPNEENKAICIAHQAGLVSPDRVKIRLTEKPLIQGLSQTDVAGNVIDTDINIANILKLPPAPTPSVITYIVGSVGEFNSRKFGEDFITTNTQNESNPASGRVYKHPYYKIIAINGTGQPVSVVLCDSGEGTIVTDLSTSQTEQDTSLYLNDPRTFSLAPAGQILPESVMMVTQIYRVQPVAGSIGVESGGGLIETEKDYRIPSFNMGVIRDNIYQEMVADPTAQVAPTALPGARAPLGPDGVAKMLNVIKDLGVSFETQVEEIGGATVPATNTCRFKCTQFQPQSPNESTYNEYAIVDVEKTIVSAECGKWSGLAGDGTAMADWTAYLGATNPATAIKIDITCQDMNVFSIAVSYANAYANTASIFTNRTILCTTGTKRDSPSSVSVARMEMTMKTRFYPLHPCYSVMPCSIYADNEVYMACDGAKYAPRLTQQEYEVGGDRVNNYRANKVYMANSGGATMVDEYNGPQNIWPSITSSSLSFPASGIKPVITLKLSKVNQTMVQPIPTPVVPLGAPNQIFQQDLKPEDAGSIGHVAGMFSAMTGQIGLPPLETLVNFDMDVVPVKTPFLRSFVVEIPNLPLAGYISKSFGEGKSKNRKGMGSRLPIVGVVPAEQFATVETEGVVNYFYKTPYCQPVQCRLSTTQFLYYMDFNLRGIADGHILEDLLHNTEITLRVHHLPDDSGMTIKEQELEGIIGTLA